MPKPERCPGGGGGGKRFAGCATNLCLFVEHELIILISKLMLISNNEKRSSLKIGLIFLQFVVGLQQ